MDQQNQYGVPPVPKQQPTGAPPPLVPPPPPRKKRSTWGFWLIIVLLLMLLAGSIMVNVFLFAGKAVTSAGGLGLSQSGSGVDEAPILSKVWSYGNGDVEVARISLDGAIMRGPESDSLFAPPEDKIEKVLGQIRTATRDPLIQGIILEVNSPGGAVTPTDEIYHTLLNFKNSQTNRAIVVFVRDLAASGGYYAAMAGDSIIAQPTSMIGSIGVIWQMMNIKGLAEKIGVDDVTIKSGENKDLLNPFNDPEDEDIALIQDLIDDAYLRFKNIVLKGRDLSPEVQETMLDGRIFSANEALEKGFIDEIGYWDQAMNAMAYQLGVDQVKVMKYHKHVDFFSSVFGAKVPEFSLGLNPFVEGPHLLYMWQP